MTNIEVDHHGLHVEDGGRGPAIVFIHGWGTSARVWSAQVPDLVADHRVVAYDWRGCGRSVGATKGSTIADNASDLRALCQRLDLGPALLVGSSIGGAFATQVALDNPEAVRGVVVLDGPGHWGAQLGQELAQLRRRLRTDRAGAVAEMVPSWFAPGTPAPLLDWTVRQILDSGPFIDELFTDIATWDPRPGLSETTVPFLYIHGRADTQIPLLVSEALAAITPAAQLLTVASGHLPHQEAPAAEITDAIRRFSLRCQDQRECP